MSQHDFNIANQGFPATRADINNAFQAIASNSSGATAPSTTYANMWWYDTTNNKMYLRNEADSAWIEVATIDQTNNEWQITTGQIEAVDIDGISFKTDDGITRMTLDDSGNLLVGKTSFDSTTEGVYISSSGAVSAVNDGATCYIANRLTSDGDIISLRKDGTTVGIIGTTGSRLYAGTGDTGLFFNDQVDSIDPWNTSTNAARDAAIDLGDGSRRFKNLYLSGGVYLGGTGAANYLDDYEEGTWTPSYDSASGLSNITGFTAIEGKYVKIGDVIHAVASFDITNTGVETMATGDYIIVKGLPFSGEKIGVSAIYGLAGTGHVYSSLGANANATAFVQLYSPGDGFYFYVQQINGTVDTADTIYVNLKYTV